jgi:hypothetical protein
MLNFLLKHTFRPAFLNVVSCCHVRHHVLSFCCIIRGFENVRIIASVVIALLLFAFIGWVLWSWQFGNQAHWVFREQREIGTKVIFLLILLWIATAELHNLCSNQPTPKTLCCVLLVLILHNGVIVDDLLTTMQQLELTVYMLYIYMPL